MKLGLNLPYEGSLAFPEAVELAQHAENLGFESVWMPEAYGTDAVSILGALAARTQRIRLGTGIVNVFSRTPALLDRKSTRLNSSHLVISYAVFCLKKKKDITHLLLFSI